MQLWSKGSSQSVGVPTPQFFSSLPQLGSFHWRGCVLSETQETAKADFQTIPSASAEAADSAHVGIPTSPTSLIELIFLF